MESGASGNVSGVGERQSRSMSAGEGGELHGPITCVPSCTLVDWRGTGVGGWEAGTAGLLGVFPVFLRTEEVMQPGDFIGRKVEKGICCSWPVAWVIAGDLSMGLAFPKANRLETTEVGRI